VISYDVPLSPITFSEKAYRRGKYPGTRRRDAVESRGQAAAKNWMRESGILDLRPLITCKNAVNPYKTPASSRRRSHLSKLDAGTSWAAQRLCYSDRAFPSRLPGPLRL